MADRAEEPQSEPNVLATYRAGRAIVPTWLRLGQADIYNRLTQHGDTEAVLRVAMDSAAIDGQVPPVLEGHFHRAMRNAGDRMVQKAEMRRLGESMATHFPNTIWDGDDALIYGEDGMMQVTQSSEESVRMRIRVFSREVYESCARAFLAETLPYVPVTVQPNGEQYLLLASEDGYSAKESRSLSLPITRDHYAPEVIEKFDRVVSELAADEPPGRLVLIEGVPGTGIGERLANIGPLDAGSVADRFAASHAPSGGPRITSGKGASKQDYATPPEFSLIPRITRIPRAPGTTRLRSRVPWMLTSVERPLWMGPGVLRMVFSGNFEVVDEEAAYAVALPQAVLWTPAMPLEVEPWQAEVWGRKLTPVMVMRWYNYYGPTL